MHDHACMHILAYPSAAIRTSVCRERRTPGPSSSPQLQTGPPQASCGLNTSSGWPFGSRTTRAEGEDRELRVLFGRGTGAWNGWCLGGWPASSCWCRILGPLPAGLGAISGVRRRQSTWRPGRCRAPRGGRGTAVRRAATVQTPGEQIPGACIAQVQNKYPHRALADLYLVIRFAHMYI